jgi:hypothetical protein
MVLPRFRYRASEKSPDTKTPPSTLRQSSSKLSKAERMELMRQKSSWTEAAPDFNVASYSRDNIHYSFLDGLNAESKQDHDHAQSFSFSLVEHGEEMDNFSQDSQSTAFFPECHDVHIFAFRATSYHSAEQTKTLDVNYCAGEDDIEVESVQQEVPLQLTRDLERFSPDKTTPVSNRLYTTTSRADQSAIPRIKANSSFTRFFAKSDKVAATKTKQTSQAPRNNDANSIVENRSMRIDQVLSETNSLQDYQEAPPPPRDGFALLAEELSLVTSPTMSTLSTHMFRLYDPGMVDTLGAVALSDSKSAGDVPSLPPPTPLNKSEHTTMPQEREASRPKLATRGVPPTLVVDDEEPGRDRADPLRVFHAAGTQHSKKDKAGRKAALLGTTLLKSRRGLFARRKTKEPMTAASKNNQPISGKMSSQASLTSKTSSKIERIERQLPPALPLPKNRRRPLLKKGAKSRQSVTGEASTKASVGRKLSGARSIRSTRSKKKVPMTFKEKTLQASLALQSQRSNATYGLDQGYDCCNPTPASAMASSEQRPDDRNDDDGIDHSFCGGYNNDQDSVDRDRDPDTDAFMPAGAAVAVGAAVVAATTTMASSQTKEPYQDNIRACREGGSSDPEESTSGTVDEQEDDVGTLTGKILQLVRNNRAERDALADDLTESSSVTAMSSVASHTKILPGRGRFTLFGAASFSKKSPKLSMIADDDDGDSQLDETEEDDQSDSTDSNSTTSSAFVDHRMTSRPRAPQTDEASAATPDWAKGDAEACDDLLFQLLGGSSSRRQRKGETSTAAHQQPDGESFDSGHDDESFDSGHDGDALFCLLQRR